jgi:predicted transcriptional regulator
MGEATFTFRVDDSLKQAFAEAAKAQDRTGAQLLRDFMREFVKDQREAAEYDAWFRREAQIGIDQANAGMLIPGEEVEAEAARWREEARRKLADRA